MVRAIREVATEYYMGAERERQQMTFCLEGIRKASENKEGFTGRCI